MSIVPGGSKCNLTELYSIGEDTGVTYGRKRHISQTFTLDEETVVFRFRFKSWTIEGDNFYHYALYSTDGAGKPTGAPLSETTLSPTGESFHSPGKWRRFDFSDFPKLVAGLYAIVASVPNAASYQCYKLSANSTTSTYTRGKCWRSHDEGDTWEEIANTDCMFEVWGWPPPPEPPPEPVISNWASKQLVYVSITDGYKIIFTTDNPCHLYMRWSLVYPQMHAIPRYRRGIWLFDDKRFCFVSYFENEQEEAGDTYTHTFIKVGWPICQTRYFYFVGTKQADQQPSTSPIFTKHRFEPPIPQPTSDCQIEYDINGGFLQYWNANCQTFTPDHDYTAVRISLMLNQHNILAKGPYVVKLTKVNGDPWEEEILWSEVGQSEELPLPGVAEWVNFEAVNIPLQEGVTYRIIVHTILGWLAWDGEEWVSGEAGAALRWWYKLDTNPYPRGDGWYGANFRDESGSWHVMVDDDFTFCLYE